MTFCSSELQNDLKTERRKDFNDGKRNWRRVHGLQFPWHHQQVCGWIALVVFLTSSFTVLIPALGPTLQPILIFVLGSLSFLHIVSHITAIFIDPADPKLRHNNPTSITAPEFDRTKHAHVIENGRCHLCNIRASGPKTKHCRVCNKCVERFDHHCKWLNHCVGARNYVAFLVCVVSAVSACFVILCVCVSELLLYNVDADWLDTAFSSTFFKINFTTSEYISSSLPISRIPFLCIVITITVLSIVAGSLLLHLCLFHVYISVLGVTTYEYIKNYRQQPSSSTASANISSSSITANNNNNNNSNNSYLNSSFCSKEPSDASLIADSGGNNNQTTFCWFCHQRQLVVNESENCTAVVSSSSSSIVRRSPIENYCTVETIEAIYKKEQVVPEFGRRKSCEHCNYCKEVQKYRSSNSAVSYSQSVPSTRSSFSCCVRKLAESTVDDAQHQYPQYYMCRRNQINPSTPSPNSEPCGLSKYKFTNHHVYVKPRRASSLNSLPALPPPPRRQIQSVSLKELNEILAYAQRPQNTTGKRPVIVNSASTIRRSSRRKSNPQLKPTKTPSLSPIHESGLSNPSTPHLKDRTVRHEQVVSVSPLTKSSV